MPSTKYDQLTSSQRKAVFHIEGPLLVLAGPGSGKTRVITYRIAALIDSGVKPQNICAITFTNKAADQMRQRVFGLGIAAGVCVSTFHSMCVRILRQYAELAKINSNFSIYNESEQLVCIKQAIKDCQLDSTNFQPARMLEAISALKNNLEDVDTFGACADDFFSKTLAMIYARYQNILSRQGALDFDDLLMKTAGLLNGCPEVCRKLSERFKYLLVDEYQDTNRAQYEIAKALVSTHDNICVTGDPDQSIYQWRGADIRNILAFEKDWPNAVVIKLEENFRSSANILATADSLIAANRKRKQKKLIATRPKGKEVAIEMCADEKQEAQAIARRIRELTEEGVNLHDIAVFYRINSMSRVLEEAFIGNQIPYQIVRGVEFYSRKEIRDILAYLKILVNPADEVSLLRIINTPARGIGKTTVNRVRDYAVSNKITFFEALKRSAHIQSLSNAPKTKLAGFVEMINRFAADLDGRVAPLAERVFVESGLKESLSGSKAPDKSAVENIEELINSAAQYDKETESPSLLGYLQQISLFSDVDSYDAASSRVALMTLHCAKGLEFENVFIIGLEQGLLPHERSVDDEDQTEEERRLFFVGITRAKSNLNISYAQYRTIRGQMLRTIPSQFLYELDVGLPQPVSESQDFCEDSTSQVFADLPCGQLVRHKKFGLGHIKEFTDLGENSTVLIKFNTGQIKTLMLKYANLEYL